MKKSEKVFQTKFTEEIKQLTKTEIKNAKTNIKKYLEGAMLSLIGLEKKYNGDYEMDHCNGRNSVLIDAFRELAITEARKIAAGYKPTKEEWSVYEKTFKQELRSQFSYVIRDIAKEKASQLAREALSRIRIDVDSVIEEEFGEKPKPEFPF